MTRNSPIHEGIRGYYHIAIPIANNASNAMNVNDILRKGLMIYLEIRS